MQLPGIILVVFSDTSPIKSELAFEGAPDALLDPSCTDPGNQPPWRFRAGAVVVWKSATSTFVPADDPTGDRNQPATVTALVAADATWAGKNVEINFDGGPTVVVPLGAQSNTNALVIADLLKDLHVAGNLLVDEFNGLLRARTTEAGAEKSIKINMPALATAFGAAGTLGAGVDADYRVTLADGDLIDDSGAPAKSVVTCCRKAHFNTAKLRNLTPEAKMVLLRRGAFFG
ncbi:MAG TPA: hypothetical protein VFF73_38030 [Planctomycetota bacterium]|nr:hypothetical protein [Planctomycetota bacterium]